MSNNDTTAEERVAAIEARAKKAEEVRQAARRHHISVMEGRAAPSMTVIANLYEHLTYALADVGDLLTQLRQAWAEVDRGREEKNVSPPPVGTPVLCLLCAHEKPWGTWDPRGVAACVDCRDAAATAAAICRIPRPSDSPYDAGRGGLADIASPGGGPPLP